MSKQRKRRRSRRELGFSTERHLDMQERAIQGAFVAVQEVDLSLANQRCDTAIAQYGNAAALRALAYAHASSSGAPERYAKDRDKIEGEVERVRRKLERACQWTRR